MFQEIETKLLSSFFIILKINFYKLDNEIYDLNQDEHCPETWTRKDILLVECGGSDGMQDALFCKFNSEIFFFFISIHD